MRERVQIEKRRALTRREVIQLMLDQNGRCGCGCGVKLEPMGEGVIDEHVIPREIGENANDLANRALYRKPCATRKTKTDRKAIDKVHRLERREDGTRRARQPIPQRKNPWPKGRKLPTKREMGMKRQHGAECTQKEIRHD